MREFESRLVNVRKEFIESVRGAGKIKCAYVGLYGAGVIHSLECNYTQAQYDKFLEALDFEYEAELFEDKLFGTIWYTDGRWSNRQEWRGFGYWTLHIPPNIPPQLKG